MSDEVGTTPTDQGTLIEELRALARSRSALHFAETSAPRLDDLVRSRGLIPPDGRQRLLDTAIASVRYPQYREAAQALLGSSSDRWQTLTQRGESAALQFGIGYDGFRRARTTGPSLLDETLSILAGSILAPAATPSEEPGSPASPGSSSPTSEPSDAPEPREIPSGQVPTSAEPAKASPSGPAATFPDPGAEVHDPAALRSKRPLAVIGVLTIVVAAAVAVVLLASQHDDDDTVAATTASVEGSSIDAATPATCEQTSTITASTPELEPYTDTFSARTAEIVGDPTNGCPTGTLQKWDAFVYQQFADANGTDTGVLAATDPSAAVWFTDAQWGSYHQVGGKSGDNAQALMGIAQAPIQYDGYVVIPTDTDAILVGETSDSPHFFLLGPARSVWEGAGGSQGPLGLPASNPVVIGGALTQDFDGGYLEQLPDTSVVSHLVADPGADLPPLDDLREKIVRHADGTSWFIGADGGRYWIPTGQVWECLGGAAIQVDNDIRGYAVATLPYRGSATCR